MCFVKRSTPRAPLRENKHVFLSLRTDDDAAAERKVAVMLETVNKVKWATAESAEEQEEKVGPG